MKTYKYKLAIILAVAVALKATYTLATTGDVIAALLDVLVTLVSGCVAEPNSHTYLLKKQNQASARRHIGFFGDPNPTTYHRPHHYYLHATAFTHNEQPRYFNQYLKEHYLNPLAT